MVLGLSAKYCEAVLATTAGDDAYSIAPASQQESQMSQHQTGDGNYFATPTRMLKLCPSDLQTDVFVTSPAAPTHPISMLRTAVYKVAKLFPRKCPSRRTHFIRIKSTLKLGVRGSLTHDLKMSYLSVAKLFPSPVHKSPHADPNVMNACVAIAP